MPRPTRPGDVLHVEIVPSRAHPGGGTVVACGETCNQRREVVQITTVGLIVAAPKLGCGGCCGPSRCAPEDPNVDF